MKNILLPIIAGLCLLFAGCGTIGTDKEPITRRVVQYAAAKAFEQHPDWAPRAVEIIGAAKSALKGETASTVAALRSLVESQIDWSGLSPADRTLVNGLLDIVTEELARRLGHGILPPDKALETSVVLGWIEQTAKLVQQ